METISQFITSVSTNFALIIVKSILKSLTTYPINMLIILSMVLIIMVQFIRNLFKKNDQGNASKTLKVQS